MASGYVIDRSASSAEGVGAWVPIMSAVLFAGNSMTVSGLAVAYEAALSDLVSLSIELSKKSADVHSVDFVTNCFSSACACWAWGEGDDGACAETVDDGVRKTFALASCVYVGMEVEARLYAAVVSLAKDVRVRCFIAWVFML